jgi:alpha-tubulin suppressor-like RCC1 family protein
MHFGQVGQLYVWGDNGSFRLGITVQEKQRIPVISPLQQPVSDLSAAWYHTAVISNGAVYEMGSNLGTHEKPHLVDFLPEV